MKQSIRTKFTLGMIFLFIIISVLCVFSGFYLNKLSGKTSAILKENYLSVVYAREMSEKLNENKKKMSVTLLSEDPAKGMNREDIEDLKTMLFRLKSMEEQASALISRIEKKR